MATHKLKGSLPLSRAIDTKSVSQKKAFENKLKGAAEMYEKLFLNEMVKSMRKTVHHSKLTQPTMAEKIYQDKLYDKYVDNWSGRGGVGLSKIIYDQLVERYSPYHKKNIQPPQGPLPVNKLREMKPLKTENGDSTYNLKSKESSEVKAPWSGEISHLGRGEGSMNILKIKHDNGLESSIGFAGELAQMKQGASVKAGEKLGQISSLTGELNWSIKPS